ncbi:hypothetical protein IMCC3317_05040 [Kordia antarctica]|uniref:Secreted effector protein PipB2 n=1 Tax=Kordia antarctica TaxID=1218801 RepID=A0A7L4ZEJ9_9FLAO|nr:pentapeptide repeat-containing protein [Kordia antarctica]QHI35158.1 hypothetical protein IMCC3317_05040 [Kordia antarctica]
MDDSKEIENLKKENEELKKIITDRDKKIEENKKNRNWFLKKIATPIIGVNLKNSIINSIDEFNEKRILSKDTIADLGANIIWRITRIGIFAVIIGLLPTILLIQQNRLLGNQNRKIEQQTSLFKSQNKYIKQQSFLSEASRRSAQMIILGDILSDLNKELQDKNNTKRILSDALVGRIVSISSVMKPYYYLEDGELIDKPLSPERGQLLISLMISKIDTAFLKENILKKCDFTYSDLQNTTIENAYLSEAKLANSSFKGSKIFNSNFKFANLSGSDFSYCMVAGGSFKQSFLTNVDVSNSSFSNTNLENSEMRRARIINVNFGGSNIKGVNFRNSILNNVNLGKVDIGKSVYIDNRNSKIMKDDFLSRPFPTNTNFKNVRYINNITVERKDWLEFVKDSLKVKGLEDLTITSQIGNQSEHFGHTHGRDGKKINLYVLKLEDSLVGKVKDIKEFVLGQQN